MLSVSILMAITWKRCWILYQSTAFQTEMALNQSIMQLPVRDQGP